MPPGAAPSDTARILHFELPSRYEVEVACILAILNPGRNLAAAATPSLC